MKVSIIIPIYNVASYVESCLISVLNQTYNDIEVILVNDCTPDESMNIVNNLLLQTQTSKDFIIINHDINRGLSAARNTGISAASGDYLYFLDSDDELSIDCIDKLMRLVHNYNDVDCICAGFKVVGANYSYPVKSKFYLDDNSLILIDYMQYKWPVMACNKLISKRLFDLCNLSFTEGLLHEDELFSFELALQANSMICIPDETYIYKVRSSETITSSIGYKNFESMYSINKYRYSVIDNMANVKSSSSVFFITSTLVLLRSLSQNKLLNYKTKRFFIYRYIKLFTTYLSLNSNLRFKDYLKLIYIYVYRLLYIV